MVSGCGFSRGYCSCSPKLTATIGSTVEGGAFDLRFARSVGLSSGHAEVHRKGVFQADLLALLLSGRPESAARPHDAERLRREQLVRGLEHRGLRDRSVPFDDERQHDPPLDALFAGLFGIAEPGLDPLPEFDQVAALEQRHALGDQKRCVVLLPGRSPGPLRGAFPRLGRDLCAVDQVDGAVGGGGVGAYLCGTGGEREDAKEAGDRGECSREAEQGVPARFLRSHHLESFFCE